MTEEYVPFSNLKGLDWVTLDTETTGISKQAEVVELSVCDGLTGNLLVDTLVKPLGEIEPKAEEVHGISRDMLEDAPDWSQAVEMMTPHIKDKTVVIYNAPFDIRIMLQSSAMLGQEVDGYYGCKQYYCAMREYARRARIYNHLWGGNRNFKLSRACELEGVTVPDNLHRAKADAILTQQLVQKILGEL